MRDIPVINGGADGSLSVGDRLDRLDGKLDRILDSIGGLARETDLRELRARVETLERESATRTEISRYSRWLLGCSIAVVAAIASQLGSMVRHP